KASRVTNDLNMYAGLSVSADGKTIVTEIRYLTSNLWVYTHGETQPRQLTEGSYGHVGLTDLHFATENRIFFDARSEVERDLWAVEIDPVRRYRMTENHGTRNTETTSSQDGQHVYFVSDRSGLDNIWRQDQKG